MVSMEMIVSARSVNVRLCNKACFSSGENGTDHRDDGDQFVGRCLVDGVPVGAQLPGGEIGFQGAAQFLAIDGGVFRRAEIAGP